MHLDPAVIAAGEEQHGVGVAEVDAPDALLVRLILCHRLAGVHVPQRHNACATMKPHMTQNCALYQFLGRLGDANYYEGQQWLCG